jgi:hypothetical protein
MEIFQGFEQAVKLLIHEVLLQAIIHALWYIDCRKNRKYIIF